MSLGSWAGNPDDALSTAVDRAVDAGIVVVVAAGNDGPYNETIGSPGGARKALTVGAIYKESESSRGRRSDLSIRDENTSSVASLGLLSSAVTPAAGVSGSVEYAGLG